MSALLHRLLSGLLVLMLASPVTALAAPASGSPGVAEVRGVLLSSDGTPAVGYQIGLRSKAGDLFLSAPTGQDGAFAIEALPPDSYRVVAFSPNGSEFPVLGREVALNAGQVERIEAKLGVKVISPGSGEAAAKGAPAGKTASGKRGLAALWGSTGGKVAIIVGGIFAAGLAISALDSNDNNNKDNNASPSAP